METRPFYIMLLIGILLTVYITNYIAPVGILGFIIIFPILFSIGKKLYPRNKSDELKRGLIFPAWFQKGIHYECRNCSEVGYTRKSKGNKTLRYSIDIIFSVIAGILIIRGYGIHGILVLLVANVIYYKYSTEVFICKKCQSEDIVVK